MAQTPQNRDLMEWFTEFYRGYYREGIGTFAQQYSKEGRSLHIGYDGLYRFDSELADGYTTKPGQLQEYAEEALRLFDLLVDVKFGQAHARMRNLPETVDIRNFKVNDDHIRTLIPVQNITRRATDVHPKITEVAFKCQCYGMMSCVPQGDGGSQEPHEYQGYERQGPFRIDFDQSNFADSQKLRVQESPGGLRGSGTPQSIDINLSDDVTGKVIADDYVTAVGVLYTEQQTSGNGKTPVFSYYTEGILLTIEDGKFEGMEISDEDVAETVELSNDSTIYEKMVESVAPAIYGYEQEKTAMILQLFSDVTKHLPDGSWIRGDLRMLLIEDLGTGKPQVLPYIRHIAPHSVYASGKGSSSAGFTAVAIHDDFGDGQQWTLEVGTLVLADKGIAVTDELSEMRPEDHSMVHEGLGQQQISVSKTGINAMLKLRCSFLGAANPECGRFNQHELIGKQIDLEPALISRLDLIFAVMDDPDLDEDSRLADYTLKANYTGEPNTQRTNVANSRLTGQQVDAVADKVAPTIDADLLRKYIAYAKHTCYPTMTDEAKRAIHSFYIDSRAHGVDEDTSVPVTVRRFEAFVRLGEVSARIRLSGKMTCEDARRVAGIVEFYSRDIGMDPETGEFDADIIKTDRLKTQHDRTKNLLRFIHTMQEEYEEGAPHEGVLECANSELNMDEKTIDDRFDELEMKGDIYELRGDVYHMT